jgi:glycerophosphoryl diester phosphodiesterase
MSKVFFSPEPLIFSVGGGEPDRPMDTIGNYAHAIELGSDVILSNVSLTADNKMVLHSRDVFNDDRVRGGGVQSLTLDELQDIFREDVRDDKAGADVSPFPELPPVLDSFPSQRFCFILNGTSLSFTCNFIETIRRMHAAERILVSASGQSIKMIRAIMPELATTFTFTGVLGFYALYRMGMISARKHFKGDALMLPETIGVSYIASPGVVGAARKRGLRVYLLDVNDEDSMRRFIESGAHGFITGNVPLIKGMLPENGAG